LNYILRDENAIYYECGYSSDNALFLKLGNEAFFVTDSRYAQEAKEQVRGAEVLTAKELEKETSQLLAKLNVKKLHYDPKEWSIYGFELLKGESRIEFVPLVNLSHNKRIIKNTHELTLLKKAAKLGRKAFSTLSKEFNRGGFGEDELRLTYMARSILSGLGEYETSFNPIVALNANASKPHALPTKKRLKNGDLLLVDAGLKYKRYCSDRTRTVHAHKGFLFDTHQTFDSKKIQKAYDTVLKAHDYAIAKARVGMKAKEIDALARGVIEKAGFGDYFVHSTGHGVGLDIHELPIISSKYDTIIEEGMVFTIEPGIYIPQAFGIRIEDMVAMVDSKAEVL